MKTHWLKALCLFAGLALLVLTARGLIVSPGAVLQVELTNVVDLCMVEWVAGPPAPWGSGSGEVITNLYTGRAYVLSAQGLTGPMLIECSTDLQHWLPFPEAGFQLTLLPENTSSIVTTPAGKEVMYFRARNQ